MRLINFTLPAVLALSGCATVVPAPVLPKAPSWDGNRLDSGVLALDAGGATVTQGYLDRYQLLIDKWGRRLGLKYGGVSEDLTGWRIDKQHLSDKAFMEYKERTSP